MDQRTINPAAIGAEVRAKGLEGGKPGWAMAFCGGKHDPQSFLAELQRECCGACLWVALTP